LAAAGALGAGGLTLAAEPLVGRYPKGVATAAGVLLVGFIGLLDYLVGPEILLGLLYLVPISLAAWFAGRKSGILVSCLSTVAWVVANVIPAHYSNPAIAFWNAVWQLGFFVVVSLLLSRLKVANEGLKKMVQEKTAALTEEVVEHRQTADALTDAAAEITERKRVEEALRQAEERYRSLVELSPDAVLVVADGRYIYSNQAAAELFAAEKAEDLIGKNVFDLIHPEYRQVVALRMDMMKDSEWPATPRASRILRLDGYPVDVEVAAAPITYESKPAIQVIFRDVTKRKLAEAKLLEARDRLAAVLESITDAFFSVDRDWRFTYVNYAAEKIFGKTRQQLLSQSVWKAFPEASETPLRCECERAVREQAPVHIESHHPRADQWYEVHAYPSPAGLSVYFRDISDRKRADKALG